jgi:hypothetical protein
MKPGIYDISNEEYHASPGISRSGIMEFKKTPSHYWHKYINPDYISDHSSPAVILGQALHTYVLEPEKFKDQYVVKYSESGKLEKIPLLKEVGREAYDLAKKNHELEKQKREAAESEFYKNSLGKEIIDIDDFKKIEAMARALEKHEQAHGLIKDAQYEKSIYWHDPDTGILCKARPDILHQNMVCDLKSTLNASMREFQRSINSYGYHLQAGMIHEGLKHALGIEIWNFIFIAIEKEEPYAIAVYPLDEVAIAHGIVDFKNTLMRFKNCLDDNYWPGYLTQMISLPTYAFYE